MARLILVHGASHGGWCWEKIVPLLEADGHEVLAPDLPACGKDQTPPIDVTLAGNTTAILRLVERRQEPVILVGHSLGGVTITQAAEASPDRIGALVYLTAIAPLDGECARDVTGRQADSLLRRSYQAGADGLTYSFQRSKVPTLFYNACSYEDAYAAMERLRPQPLGIATAPIQVTPERYGTVPRWYIECLQDNAITLSLQRFMTERLPCRTLQIDTDHSPFLSAPTELARHLLGIARSVT
jgi:pimeloyl-ACP methyl ester carboxylesterase